MGAVKRVGLDRAAPAIWYGVKVAVAVALVAAWVLHRDAEQPILKAGRRPPWEARAPR